MKCLIFLFPSIESSKIIYTIKRESSNVTRIKNVQTVYDLTIQRFKPELYVQKQCILLISEMFWFYYTFSSLDYLCNRFDVLEFLKYLMTIYFYFSIDCYYKYSFNKWYLRKRNYLHWIGFNPSTFIFVNHSNQNVYIVYLK